jgi:DNA polymerase III subunit delta
MTYFETVKEIKKGTIHPLYLLFGNETYFIQDLQQKIIHAVLDDPEDGMNLSIVDLEETPVQDAIMDAETFPFFGEKKVLILKNASIFKANPEKVKVDHNTKVLEDYIAQPVEHTIVIMIAPYEKIDERKKVVKKMKENGKVVKCEQAKEKDLTQWIDMLVRQHGVEIEPQATQLLIEEVGTDLMAIQTEVQKFTQYISDDPESKITVQVVKELVSRHTESSAFVMVDAVMKRDLPSAISTFKDLVKNKEEPIALLALFASQIRLILQCKLLKSKGYSSQQMKSVVKAHPFAIKMALERERHFTLEQLYGMISLLAKTDEQMKRGEIEKELAFELLLHNFISIQNR